MKRNTADLELEKIESLVKTQLSKSELLIPANLDFVNELNSIINDRSRSSDFSALRINIYSSDTLLYWNDPVIIDYDSEASEFLQIDKGQTYTIKRDLNLFDDSGKISSNIIKEAKAEHQFSKSTKADATHEIVLNGIPVYLKKMYPTMNKWKTILCFSLLLISTILFLFWHNLFSKQILHTSRSVIGLFSALAILLLTRFGLSQIDFYSCYILEQIFNPSNDFSILHRSVGDVFWNSSFLFSGVLLLCNHRLDIAQKTWTKILVPITLMFVSLAILIGFVFLTKGLIFTTEIIIDNNQIISFDKHSLLEILSLVLILMSSFFLHYSTAERMKKWKLNWHQRTVMISISMLMTLPIYLYFIDYPSAWLFYISISAFLLMQDLFVDNKIKNLPWTIWWMVLYAGFTAALVFGLSFQKRIIERSAFLDQIHISDDSKVNREVLQVKEAIIQSGILEKIGSLPYPGKFEKSDIQQYLRSSIAQLPENLLDPEFDIFIFDGYANNYFSNDFTREDELISDISTAKLIRPDVYYNPFKRAYLLSFFIENDNYPGNRLRIYFGLKAQNTLSIKEVETDYIVYQNTLVLKKQNNNNTDFDKFINLDNGKYFIERNSIIVKEKKDGLKLISVEAIANLLKPMSLFSFFFLFIGLLLFSLTVINSVYEFLPESLNLKFKKANSLRSRLQLMVIALIIISFLFIGFVSFYYFKNILESNQNQEFVRDLEKIQKDIYATNKDALDDQGSLIILSNSLQELSEIHNVDISLYDRNAVLINSINRSKKPNLGFATANLFNLNPRLNTVNTFSNQEYFSFIALKRLNPMIYGFAEINHRSTDKIAERLREFISTILNLYVFLFLLAGAIAISVANSITFPLTVLSQKLKQTKLGRKNEQLEWDSRDEIGILIQEYNSMISQLEESATLLAKTERDHAWKEMAKQVAHEVKNPLTPMKLSVQSLERAINADPENTQAIIRKTSRTLVEQIDTLTEIANSFANLAKMPKGSKEKLVINELVENVHELFEGREDFDFQLILPIDDMYIFADRNQLIRILNNLVKNASQAISTERRGKVVMELSQKGQNALIRVSDNGIGIPEEARSKIFTPNFTTKSTGTGIGLAMCANMIETINGRIYFESMVDKGSDFFVEIPLLRV